MNKNQSQQSYNRSQQYLRSHLRALCAALGELFKSPLISLMTFSVIGVVISLPLCFYGLTKNVQKLTNQWSGHSPTLSLYIDPNTKPEEIKKMEGTLKNNPKIAKVTYISPQSGLEHFEKQTGLNGIIKLFNKNPLPGVFIVSPTLAYQQPLMIKQLFFQLKNNKLVNNIQLDMVWVKKLYYAVAIGKRIALALAILFGIGILLIIGNTLRLALHKHEKEIKVLKLIGATNNFIRRPFLYRGFLLGFFGGFVACLLTTFFFVSLDGTVTKLAIQYNTSFHLSGLSLTNLISVSMGTGFLGLFGTWLIVTPLISEGMIIS